MVFAANGFNLTNTSGANFNAVANAIDGAITCHWGGTTGGAANAYTLTPSPAWTTATRTELRYIFAIIHANNTGASTLVVSGISGTPAIRQSGAALTGGELKANFLYLFCFDGTNFHVVSPSAMPPIRTDGLDVYINTTTKRNNSRISFDFDGNASGGFGINDVGAINGAVFLSFLTGGTFRGSITNNNNTAVAYNTTSDRRLKSNIRPLTGARERVAAYLSREWEWADGQIGRGFVADELQAVEPSAVSGEKDAVDAQGNPIYQGVDPRFIVHDLVAVLQEEMAAREALEARLAAIEAKLSLE